VLASSCTDRAERERSAPEAGGILRLAALSDPLGAGDPAVELNRAGWELYRCCLLRTLLSYTGMPAGRGGTSLHPDLAATPPRVSDDGRTWTFHLQEGLRYAPPFEDTEIVAEDSIRALQRQARLPSAYVDTYSVIEGFDEYVAGDAASITGLVARDRTTLVVRLTEPAGDLGYRLSLPAAAPIPEGAALGHEGSYAGFLAASGPYMLAGSEDLTPSEPPGEQEPARGYEPGRSITLVRNPSWSPSADDLRPAYADRIQVRIGSTPEEIARAVERGTIDLQLDGSPPFSQIRRYQRDPALADRIHMGSGDVVHFAPLNLAIPPFDDVHVRRAVNLAVDRAALLRSAGGPLAGRVTTEVMPPGLTGGRTAGFEPFALEGHGGDLQAAAEEIIRSAYDRNGNGRCDVPACHGIRALVANVPPFPDQAFLIREALLPLGIRLAVDRVGPEGLVRTLGDPATKVAVAVGPTWGKLYPDGASFAIPLFSREGVGPGGCCNYSLVGASLGQLERFGYRVRDVPGAGARIDRCQRLVGEARAGCWADLDRVLSVRIVPWIPYLSERNVDVVSERILSYSFDQFASMASIDRLAVAPGS
jgi:peptide/nickel transport system substrate-binding protein